MLGKVRRASVSYGSVIFEVADYDNVLDPVSLAIERAL
jgi:hypothetical protein